MGWRDSQASTPVEKIENIENMKTEGHKFDKFDKFDRDGIVTTETIFCDFLNRDVDRKECYKPKGCFHRDEDDRPVECQHLKMFVKQRNKEVGIQI